MKSARKLSKALDSRLRTAARTIGTYGYTICSLSVSENVARQYAVFGKVTPWKPAGFPSMTHLWELRPHQRVPVIRFDVDTGNTQQDFCAWVLHSV